jgi:CRP-like cAMP-binding protein
MSNRLVEPARSAEMVEALLCSVAASGARRVRLAPLQVLGRAGLPVEDVYLIEAGLVSAMASAGRNHWVECYSVGPRGVVGLPSLALGIPSPTKKVVQVEGAALKIPARAYRASLKAHPGLMSATLAQLGALVLQAAHTGVCNGQHTAAERVSRWLAVASRKAGSPRLRVSHATVAKCLGVRRATVSACLENLQRIGAVSLERKLIEIRSERALHAGSCPCSRYFDAREG